MLFSTALAGCATHHKSAQQKSIDDGYALGTSDSIKREYWLKQSLEKSKGDADTPDNGKTVYYTVDGSDKRDGEKLVPSKVTVPVKE